MSKITLEQARKAYEGLNYNWERDEERHYCETYDVDDAYDIPTSELKEHNYKDLIVLGDFLNQKKPDYQRQVKEILFEYIAEKDKQEVFKRIITEIGVKK